METISVPKDDWKILINAVTNIEIALAGSHVLGTKGIIWEVGRLKEQMAVIQETEHQRKGIIYAIGIAWATSLAAIGIFLGIKK